MRKNDRFREKPKGREICSQSGVFEINVSEAERFQVSLGSVSLRG